jgi:hypothetical protein
VPADQDARVVGEQRLEPLGDVVEVQMACPALFGNKARREAHLNAKLEEVLIRRDRHRAKLVIWRVGKRFAEVPQRTREPLAIDAAGGEPLADVARRRGR